MPQGESEAAVQKVATETDDDSFRRRLEEEARCHDREFVRGQFELGGSTPTVGRCRIRGGAKQWLVSAPEAEDGETNLSGDDRIRNRKDNTDEDFTMFPDGADYTTMPEEERSCLSFQTNRIKLSTTD